MKPTKVVIAAFTISTVLSLVIGTFLLSQARTIPKHTRLIRTGEEIRRSIIEMQLLEQAYLLHHQEDVLELVADKTDNLRKILSFYEKPRLGGEKEEFFEFAAWEEAMNLYERLFDQFTLYHQAVEKSIADIRELEKSILAVIYSKMNPERGIIGLQEIRIHEKGYLVYRNHPKPPGERSFEEMRKEAVANLVVWAHEDKRIEELMEKDDQLFNEILTNYESQDTALVALKRESEKIKAIGETFFEEGNNRLRVTYRRCVFLCTTLLVMWVIVALAILTTRFR
jgi:hypothetical protein